MSEGEGTMRTEIKTKEYTLYICEICGKESENIREIKYCETIHNPCQHIWKSKTLGADSPEIDIVCTLCGQERNLFHCIERLQRKYLLEALNYLYREGFEKINRRDSDLTRRVRVTAKSKQEIKRCLKNKN